MNPTVTAFQTFQMLEQESLWNVAVDCHARLLASQIPHAVIGGVAVCLHGYRRTTVDLDLLVTREDVQHIREVLEAGAYNWHENQAEFRSPAGIPVHFVLSGDRAGKDSDVTLPDPSAPNVVQEIEGLPVIALPKLIESKLACGIGNLRRTHRDLADVVELIAVHKLGTSFARKLHKSLRPAFRELVQHAREDG